MILETNDLLKFCNDSEKNKILTEVIENYHKEVLKEIPNYDLFSGFQSGKEFGDVAEAQIIDSFDDIEKFGDGTIYDANFKEDKSIRIEIKSAKMLRKTTESRSLKGRIMSITEENKHRTSAKFEQVKPYACDWFIFHMVFGDGDMAYAVPSFMISEKSGADNKEENKFLLSTQHRGNEREGQVSITKTFIESKMFMMDGYSFNNKNDNLSKYLEIVANRLKANGIDVPDKLLLKK